MHTEMAKMRWRAFGHMLRLPLTTPCQLAISYYFEKPNKAKMFSGRKRMTLPLKIHNDIENCWKEGNIIPGGVKSFKSDDDLEKLRKSAADRETWKKITDVILSTYKAKDVLHI